MYFIRNHRLTTQMLISIATAWLALAQSQPTRSARNILDLTQNEQIQFINTSLEQSWPEDRTDAMTMLVINRSSLIVPILESRIEELLKLHPTAQRLIDIASEMIAYAGDEESLKAIAKLMAIDGERFAPLVGNALTHSMNCRNPFTVAYRGLEIGDEAIARSTIAWAESALASTRMRRAWAEAMLDRHGKAPGETQWASDSIASRLRNSASVELRQTVLGFAAEAQRKREQR